jgi:hypothetical protein
VKKGKLFIGNKIIFFCLQQKLGKKPAAFLRKDAIAFLEGAAFLGKTMK